MKKKLIIFSVLLLVLDQLSKILVMNLLNLGSSITLIPNFLDITYIENNGAALNILSGKTWLLITVSVIALIYIIKVVVRANIKNNIQMITYSMLISGIIGNIIDRVVYGKVIDFISFRIFSYDAPIFNIADSLIVIGAILLVILLARGDKNAV